MDHNRQSDLHRTVAPLRRKIDGATGRLTRGATGRWSDERTIGHELSPSPRRPVALSLCLLLCLAGCSRPVTEAEKRAAVDEFFTRARSCWPSDGESAAPLAVESVVSDKNATSVRLAVYARDEAVDFYLPVYRLSAGRWSVNEKGRVYLLDEQCREFKLSDSKPSPKSSLIFWGGGRIPEGGRIRLKPGQVFELTLVFPSMLDRTRVGALVYDGRVLPFALE
jgi:hypothetical protein